MQIQWSKLLVRTGAWICTEVALTCLGLDDLADYSEFIFQQRLATQALSEAVCLVVTV
ncbi:hypothetical protein IQ266_09865 [filamentous cyanobacterium LEGE 11480]|uniref:Uncharacterized protein n=1 Tax=Romeriopsis navalis LEGE 11480 TaxID=2777977 RepID=A0A928Z474_9CYAN|nr:hypothetical protein [Romeriopsis navalis]MBE9030033.1 hypothetical protein [Romeriopsis navalis LEGE 11480]